MIRERIARSGFGNEVGFTWRGGDVSRIEGFSDNVFGFALTLLVVTLEVPKTFLHLAESLQGFVAFALAFALLSMIWFDHYRFFRRYGLTDHFVLVVNFFLLFVVLFFVYPLKFLFTFLVKVYSGGRNEFAMPDGTLVKIIEAHQWPTMMVVYALGFIVIYFLLFLLYRHAYRCSDQLELTETERIHTKSEMVSKGANIFVGLISIAIVVIGGSPWAGISGLAYCLIGPFQTIIGIRTAKKVKKILSVQQQG